MAKTAWGYIEGKRNKLPHELQCQREVQPSDVVVFKEFCTAMFGFGINLQYGYYDPDPRIQWTYSTYRMDGEMSCRFAFRTKRDMKLFKMAFS